jgi:hypothetical protein
LKYDVVPDEAAVYHSLRIKVNVKSNDTGKRQNFKVILKYDKTRDKMLFLSPLNQIYGLLVVDKERALLINTKRKKYWRGPFNILLQEIWGMDFDYLEFKRLIVEGTVPENNLKEKGIKISFEKGTAGKAPERLRIRTQDLLVKVKISNRRRGKGIIRFSRSLKGMKRAEIEELLE